VRIAQIAPLYESVPPRLYGGTERVVSYLTEELVRLGHDVTLYASGDSRTTATLVPGSPRALWRDPQVRETLPHHVLLNERVFRDADHFDVLHFHGDYIHFPLVRRDHRRTVTTIHGWMYPSDLAGLFEEFRDVPLVSISDAQRQFIPCANWQATVYHGLPRDEFTFNATPENYLAFLGRMSPEKGVERAVEIARRAGVPLKIAGKIYPEERGYFDDRIAPLLRQASAFVSFTGELGGTEKTEFLGKAKALLFPIDWPEPFGLVMIEAMACGTPTIAWKRGSVPEVIEEGVTGFIVDTIDDAVDAVRRIGTLERQASRRVFETRFDAARMARDYVQVYRALR
jgi:glycosyltransferase involved in cell wall biosynthesis